MCACRLMTGRNFSARQSVWDTVHLSVSLICSMQTWLQERNRKRSKLWGGRRGELSEHSSLSVSFTLADRFGRKFKERRGKQEVSSSQVGWEETFFLFFWSSVVHLPPSGRKKLHGKKEGKDITSDVTISICVCVWQWGSKVRLDYRVWSSRGRWGVAAQGQLVTWWDS